jgi:NodT family efflux transporter outer membrane factor (OMF) lipoprotein
MMSKIQKLAANRLILAFGASALLGLASGCMVGPRYHPPSAPSIAAKNYKESTVNFKNEPGWKVAQPGHAMLHGNWWEVFHDPQLNKLETQLNINNQNIRIYFENFLQARALIAQARANYWPTLTTSPAWRRTKASGNMSNTYNTGTGASTKTSSGQKSTQVTLPFDISWAPDLWGKIRHEVHSAEYGAQVSAADLANEKLTEQASLAAFYFQLRGQDALIDILKKTVAADQKAYEVNEGSYKAGIGDYISVVEARSTLESTQAQLTNLRIARAQYEHAIAVLVGKIPTNFSLAPNPGFFSPPPIPVGVPSELLERRPDVAAAERTLAEANSTIGIGYGAFFPSVLLSVSGGFESSTFKHWFDWPSRFWSLGPAITQTIFNGWLYRAQLHQYTAIYNADLAGYRQTVLTAFEQVEDSLAATRLYSQQIKQRKAALKDAQHYLQLEQARYQSGIDPYLNVITAQTTVLSEQETLAASQVNEMTSAVHLIEALGGGWDRSQLPTPAQTGKKVPKSEYALQH